MTLTAADILKTPPNAFASILGSEPQAVRKSFRKLAQVWHPDHCDDPKAADVLQHLVRLKTRALDGGASSAADRPGVVLDVWGARALRIRPLATRKSDTGDLFVLDRSVAYRFLDDHLDLFEREEQVVRDLEFADSAMRKEMERFLPAIVKNVELDRGGLIAYARTDDQILLADLIAHVGKIEPAHVAWIVSGLLNVVCYLQWARISHGSISTTDILVSPKHHSVSLMGGFGFSARFGEPRQALPERTLSMFPAEGMGQPLGRSGLDVELTRLVGRECLGDPAGGQLLGGTLVPAAMANFLVLPGIDDAFEAYAAWGRVLEKSFGPRKFVNMNIDPTAVYSV